MFRNVPECSGMFRDVPCSGFYRRPLKTDLANLRFLCFEKGEACQSILIMLRGKIGLSRPEVKKISSV